MHPREVRTRISPTAGTADTLYIWKKEKATGEKLLVAGIHNRATESRDSATEYRKERVHFKPAAAEGDLYTTLQSQTRGLVRPHTKHNLCVVIVPTSPC